MRLRPLLALTGWVVMVAQGCQCSGCPVASAPPPLDSDAGLQAAPQALRLDAGSSAAGLIDAGPNDALPYEIANNALPEDESVALYAKDCHAVLSVTFDDMDGYRTTPECDAMALDQNCAPDTFGCWTAAETCQQNCKPPCHDCQAGCATTCDDCKARCGSDATCLTACARSRYQCRTRCLQTLAACRHVTCNGAMRACEARGEAQRTKLCPDCDAIAECMVAAEKTGKRDACLTAGNAPECLEWCYIY